MLAVREVGGSSREDGVADARSVGLGGWVVVIAVGVASFVAGRATAVADTEPAARPVETAATQDPARVTGIGGVFFTSDDPDRTREWYREHLGIDAADWGGFAFRWREDERPDETGYTVWGVFPTATDYFAPSPAPFMLNFRVRDLAAVIERLRLDHRRGRTEGGAVAAGAGGGRPVPVGAMRSEGRACYPQSGAASWGGSRTRLGHPRESWPSATITCPSIASC